MSKLIAVLSEDILVAPVLEAGVYCNLATTYLEDVLYADVSEEDEA